MSRYVVNPVLTYVVIVLNNFFQYPWPECPHPKLDRSAPITNPTDTLREKLKSKMWQRAAESWVGMEEPENVGLMKQVEQLKDRATGLSKPERYFKLVEFNSVFFVAVSKLRFLP